MMRRPKESPLLLIRNPAGARSPRLLVVDPSLSVETCALASAFEHPGPVAVAHWPTPGRLDVGTRTAPSTRLRGGCQTPARREPRSTMPRPALKVALADQTPSNRPEVDSCHRNHPVSAHLCDHDRPRPVIAPDRWQDPSSPTTRAPSTTPGDSDRAEDAHECIPAPA